jgi:hypothetical protein
MLEETGTVVGAAISKTSDHHTAASSVARCDLRAPAPGMDGIDAAGELLICAAAVDATPVEGLTHNHYRYPARFSPQLARAVIAATTSPGDLVADTFMGGGTTCVEAMAAGRRSVGIDISTLASFVAAAKTTLPADADLGLLVEWARAAAASISMRAPEPVFPGFTETGYMRNLGGSERWRLRKAVAQAAAAARELDGPTGLLARCAVLRTAQWALDGRRNFPDLERFRRMLVASGESLAAGARLLEAAAGSNPNRPLLLSRSCIGVENAPELADQGPARLVLTSPPYPGVHVLYHRWQVGGGQETAAPFLIADRLDGAGSSYYTMGDRKARGLEGYFVQLRDCMTSIAAMSDQRTSIVQVVAFGEPSWQLPRYLEMVAKAGLEERGLHCLSGIGDGRLWRDVPNRRWHANRQGRTGGSREVVFFHRLVR